MNWFLQTRHRILWVALIFGLLLAAGCAALGTGPRAARPGDGIREYRRLAGDLRKLVTDCVAAAEVLAKASAANSTRAQARFDQSAQRLEVASITARARIEAMEQRGEAYFEEWAGKDSPLSAADRERFVELRQHFNLILSGTHEARQEFRQFIDGVRGLRAQLAQSPEPATIASVKPVLAEVAAEGRQVEAALDRLMQTLNMAETAVMSGVKQPADSGGKP